MPFILPLYPFGSKDYTFVYEECQLEEKFETIKSTLQVLNMQNEAFHRGKFKPEPHLFLSPYFHLPYTSSPFPLLSFTKPETPDNWHSYTKIQ